LFCFQAEDGIRDFHVTGVQTCALPISGKTPGRRLLVSTCKLSPFHFQFTPTQAINWSRLSTSRIRGIRWKVTTCSLSKDAASKEIGRASCRERGSSARHAAADATAEAT